MSNNDVISVKNKFKKIPLFYKLIIIYLIWCYLYGVSKDIINIFSNIKKDINTKNLNLLSILYNALIKYPLLGFLPSSYFKYKLYKNSHKNYLSFFKIYPLMAKKNIQDLHLFDNKLLFKLYINNKIKQPKIIAFYSKKNKRIIHYSKPNTDRVVIKPIKGAGGKGLKILSSNNFENFLINSNRSYLVEELIKQHEFINKIYNNSVNTLRVLTIKKKEKIDVISIILKVGTYLTNSTDNIIKGGIPIAINLDTGILLKAHFYKDHDHIEYTKHPETKFEFYKKKIPFFLEIKEIAMNAHKLFPRSMIVGWDIALTENGPVIIEGNGLPDISNMQICDQFKKRLNTFLIEKDEYL